MLVSGMLFSCTNNNQSEETSSVDSTASVLEATSPVEVQSEELEAVEIESTADSVEAETEEAVQ